MTIGKHAAMFHFPRMESLGLGFHANINEMNANAMSAGTVSGYV